MSSQSQTTADPCLLLLERVGSSALANGSNFVFSPLSIRTALSLAAVGSKGGTLTQFLSFLGSPTVADLNSAAAKFLGSIRSDSGSDSNSTRLTFVNGVWVDKSTPLKASFKEVAENVYGAVAESVDFQNQAAQVAKEVNAWVEKATNGLITDLLPIDSIGPQTRVTLANALYFRGIWSEKFDKSKTTNKDFHLLNGSTVQVPFMTSKEDQFISSSLGFKVLRLPYLKHQENRSFSMLLFLPDKTNGVQNLVEMAVSDPNFFNRHVPMRRKDVGNFMIPKFKVSSGFEASEMLKSLGLELPFSQHADFKEMVLDAELFVSSVHHKATIEVEEEGTTAAAATGLGFTLCCYSPPVDFVADHPFIFAIREDETGALSFAGHVANPSVVETSV